MGSYFDPSLVLQPKLWATLDCSVQPYTGYTEEVPFFAALWCRFYEWMSIHEFGHNVDRKRTFRRVVVRVKVGLIDQATCFAKKLSFGEKI